MTEPEPEKAAPAEPNKGGMSNLAVRLLTAAVVVPVLLWALFWGPWGVFFGIVTFASFVAATELASMTLAGHRLLQAWAVVASLATFAVVYFRPHDLAVTTCLVAVVGGGFMIALTRPDPIETAGARMAWLVVTPLYAGAMLAVIALLHRLDNGGGWVVLSMMLAWFSDTGGYFAGRAFGKHKLYPKVSPKKTVEGAVGGLAGSVVGALLAHFWYLPELPLVPGIGLAVLASAAGQLGDLTISLIKRSVHVKDSGWIIPGHGGLLDRIDALVMTGTLTWLYTAWFL
jgi:phosphatidate cytidylyltransferase